MEAAIVTLQDIETVLTTDSISTRKEIIDRLEKRIAEIMQLIFNEFHTNSSWWDWDETEDGSYAKFKNSNITADKSAVKIYLETRKELTVIDRDGNAVKIYYERLIPTRWLWEDCEQEIKNGITAFKALKVQKQLDQVRLRQEMNLEKTRLIQSAMLKLTDEEKWALGNGRLPKSLSKYKDLQ